MLAAIGLAWRAQALGRHAIALDHPLDRSRLGTPALPRREAWRLRLRLALPWLLPLGLMVAVRAVGPLWRTVPPGNVRWAAVAGVALLWAATFASVAWAHRQQGRRSLEARYEPIFNAFALKRLDADTRLRRALLPGEVLHETFIWVRHRVHWIVLTDQRLLCFTRGLRGWRLAEALALSRVQEVVYAPQSSSFWRRWLGAGAGGPGWLQMQIEGLGLWQGRVTAPPLAQRVARRFGGRVQAAA